MQRRKLLNWFGLGVLSSWLSTAIAACTSTSTPTSGSATSGASGSTSGIAKPGGFLRVGTLQDLKQKGRILFKEGETSVIVTNDLTKADKLYAVNSVCTHKGCAVDWNTDKKEIFCSCHGSTFKADGTIVKGPAAQPLKAYETKIEGDAVLVKVSG
jgi:cytochrome b6-f complex iron-sulfur subunit